MSQHIDRDERIITIEDAVELRLQQPHVVQMETRPPNIEGVGQIAQRELVRNALRMRPDRIIVGEVRGPEAFDMLQAMNTGHDGSMSTVHANSPRDALYRVENMVMMANLEPAAARRSACRSPARSICSCMSSACAMASAGCRASSRSPAWKARSSPPASSSPFSTAASGTTAVSKATFESTRMRPDFVARAARFGLERELLDALGIGGA